MEPSIRRQDRCRKNTEEKSPQAVARQDNTEGAAAGPSESGALRIYFNEAGGYPLLSKSEEARLSKIILDGKKSIDQIFSVEGLDRNRLQEARDQIAEKRLSGRERLLLVKMSLGFSGRKYHRLVEQLERIENRIKAAKNKLVLSNLRLVVKIARPFAGGRISLEDLVQEGSIGLMMAAERYDHARGYRFSTYAVWWIQKYIFSAINQQFRTIRIPDHVIKILSRIQKVSQGLMQEHGRRPSLEEIAHASALDLEQAVLTVVANQEPVSLDAPMDEEEKNVLEYYLQDSGQLAPGHFLELEALQRHLEKAITESLSAREASVIRLRYGMNGDDTFLKPSAIGERIGLSERRIRQIEKKALEKLKTPASRDNLKAFLFRTRN